MKVYRVGIDGMRRYSTCLMHGRDGLVDKKFDRVIDKFVIVDLNRLFFMLRFSLRKILHGI